MKAKKEKTEKPKEEKEARMPDYSDYRRTNGRSRVQLAVWVNETDTGPRFGTRLEYQYLSNGSWKQLDHPLPDQWLATAKLLSDADTWRHRYLQERHKAESDKQQ